MAIHNAADNSFKRIFGNHVLFLDFLRDFIRLDIFNQVKPEDIEDISERFLPLFQDNRDSDTVKRINLKNTPTPLFVIAILEHESKVNHRSSFKMLQYICLVLDAWEKEVDRDKPGTSSLKDFNYPPVLPIIFYDGRDTWTAETNFYDRTSLNTAFKKYIPKFEYELVNLNDYNEQEIMRFSAGLSIIMLIDKLRGSGRENVLKNLPPDYTEKLSLQIPESMRKLLSDVIQVLLEKGGVARKEAERFADFIEKPKGKEYKGMFEAVIESIIEEREEAHKAGIVIGQEQGIVIGQEQGIAIGLGQGIELAARNALAKGYSLDVIHDITGLDVETIKSLDPRS
ncbi:MAG: Rpn family recombination-promoting nuclease/putative transposase [Treponema sp.]|nr:Rpn family recombination-promoting nuclease/putative transposase [Treponema sp.]